MARLEFPEWWDWEVDTGLAHLQKRMRDRGFNEADLRTMLEDAEGLREDHEPGRYVVETRHGGKPWHVIVEPQVEDQVLLVVTAYKRGD